MILLIDNYDSFTFNIYQYLREMNLEVLVKRNNEISLAGIKTLAPSHIIISPGPGHPGDAGISVELVKAFKGVIPILGICLGHQAIGEAFGGKIDRAVDIFHGKTSSIHHDGKGCFNGIKNPFTAVRYHSLAIDKISMPPELEISAVSSDGEIMGVRHKQFAVEGIQFHPESIGTEFGREILINFIKQERPKPLMQASIKKVYGGDYLTEEEARQVMDDIMSGKATASQIAGFLTALGMRGESVDELTGFARVMRRKASPVRRPAGQIVIDTCGTGGDGSGTFNISTISALVAAGAGVTVAKHGNRSITSRCGSADLLEVLGVNLSSNPDDLSLNLEKNGISFLFAPRLHSAMRYAAPVRAELGIRTVFNILGPLSNPAGADVQLLGVFSNDIREKVAQVLVNLGVKRAMVVHGSDGMDEITMTGPTFVSEINEGWIKNYTLEPREFGFEYCRGEDLQGGDLKANRDIALDILKGKQGPKRDVVLLNAGAAIYLASQTLSLNSGIHLAAETIDSGKAMAKLEQLATSTQ